MQILIKYTKNYGKCRGGIETITTPLNSEYDNWRTGFSCIESNRHWALIIEKFSFQNTKHASDGRWIVDPVYGIKLISDTPCSEKEYGNWLNKYVELIEIDGREFWINERLENREELSCLVTN